MEIPDRPAGSSEAPGNQPVQPRAEEQLKQLIRDHERPLYAFIYSLLPDPRGVHDCLQDTYMRAYQRFRNGDRVETAWLYQEGYNRAMEERRQ